MIKPLTKATEGRASLFWGPPFEGQVPHSVETRHSESSCNWWQGHEAAGQLCPQSQSRDTMLVHCPSSAFLQSGTPDYGMVPPTFGVDCYLKRSHRHIQKCVPRGILSCQSRLTVTHAYSHPSGKTYSSPITTMTFVARWCAMPGLFNTRWTD